MDCYNFSKGSFYFNLFQDFNKFFREMYTSEDSNALFSQYSEKFSKRQIKQCIEK